MSNKLKEIDVKMAHTAFSMTRNIKILIQIKPE